MSDRNSTTVLADQRYYYAVVLETARSFDARYLRRMLDRPELRAAYEGHELIAETLFLAWETEIAFGTGESLESFRVRGRSARTPIYSYPFFVNSFQLGRRPYVILGFPVVRLAALLIDKLIEHGLLREATFARVDVQTVVDAVQKGGRRAAGARISKLVTNVKGDSIQRIAIGGKDAVHSRAYQTLQEHMGRTAFGARHCIVSLLTPEKISISTHVDNYGNFRFWMQSGFRNLPAIPEFVRLIESLGGLDRSTATPHLRMELNENIAEEVQ